jgi:hypothetical protein
MAHGGIDMYRVMEEGSPAGRALDEVRETVERARTGDRHALPRLRELLDERPEIWRSYGDVSGHARGAWVALIAGDDLALAESTTRRADAMRAEIAGAAPTPLEALLADRVVATWLQLAHAEGMVAQAGASLKQASFADRRLASVEKRHIAAISALTLYRRLLGARMSPPTIELPIGEPPSDATADTENPPVEPSSETNEAGQVLPFRTTPGRRGGGRRRGRPASGGGPRR